MRGGIYLTAKLNTIKKRWARKGDGSSYELLPSSKEGFLMDIRNLGMLSLYDRLQKLSKNFTVC